jgi:hypothetical protein
VEQNKRCRAKSTFIIITILHYHYYIKEKEMVDVRIHKTKDRVLQVARYFLPYRFKRSFTIAFIEF